MDRVLLFCPHCTKPILVIQQMIFISQPPSVQAGEPGE
jgi:hypothetical protein